MSDATFHPDRPLSFHFRVDKKWLKSLDLPKARSSQQARANGAILADAYVKAKAYPDAYTSYSRNNNFYNEGKRYRGTDFTAATVPAGVDALAAADLLENEKASPGTRGRQSRFRAGERLLKSIEKLPPPKVTRVIGELIRLKNEQKQLIDYRDSDVTRDMRRAISPINEMSRACKIEVPGLTQIDGTPLALCGLFRSIVDMSRQEYFRVFNNASFELGGRLYGHYVQSVPKLDRRAALMNGDPVAEYDYSALHARLLLAMCGESKRARDFDCYPYFVAGYSRQHAKAAFNCIINARSPGSAKNALAWKLAEWRLGRELDEARGEHPTAQDHGAAGVLLQDALQAYAWARQYFFSGIGLQLQRKDSDLIIAVAHKLLKAGIDAIFLHDSVLTQARHIDTAKSIMTEQLIAVICELAGIAKIGICNIAEIRDETNSYAVFGKEVFLHNGPVAFLPVSAVSSAGVVPSLVVSSFFVLFLSLSRPSLLQRTEGGVLQTCGVISPGIRYGGLCPIDAAKDIARWTSGLLPFSVRAAALHELGARGVTQQQLAALIGISRPQLTNALRGRFGLGDSAAARLKAWLLSGNV